MCSWHYRESASRVSLTPNCHAIDPLVEWTDIRRRIEHSRVMQVFLKYERATQCKELRLASSRMSSGGEWLLYVLHTFLRYRKHPLVFLKNLRRPPYMTIVHTVPQSLHIHSYLCLFLGLFISALLYGVLQA